MNDLEIPIMSNRGYAKPTDPNYEIVREADLKDAVDEYLYIKTLPQPEFGWCGAIKNQIASRVLYLEQTITKFTVYKKGI